MFQVGLYLIFDRYQIKHVKILVLFALVLGYLFLFDDFISVVPEEQSGSECGLANMAILICFWGIGIFTLCFTYLIYYLISQYLLIQKLKNDDE